MTDIILNEEGKINGSSPNREVTYNHLFGNGNDKTADIIFGDFVILGVNDEGEFISLPPEDKHKGTVLLCRPNVIYSLTLI